MTRLTSGYRSLSTLLLVVALGPPIATGTSEDERVVASRELTATFQQQLGGRLQAVMSQGGPVAAIEVCRAEAPEIAARLSAGSPATVGRVSRKARNLANRADAKAAAVLVEFDAVIAADSDARPEHFAAASDGSALYLKAIVTQPLCLICHGANLSAEVQSALQSLYPEDAATGYAPGQLRGAFRVRWPAEAAP